MHQTPQHLLSTSWTVHRLSPLHHRKEYHSILGNEDALKTYAKRLQDLLTGDVLRGVQVGLSGTTTLSDDALVKAGALTDCRWETIPTWSYWDEERLHSDDPSEQRKPIPLKETMGILVTLEYENVTYKAALLAGPDGYSAKNHGDDDRKDSTYLPLLLTRLPNPLRQTFVSFLSVTFDSYCSVLRLPSSFLCATLESYIASLAAADEDSQRSGTTSRVILEAVMKETQLTLAFAPSISPALKTLDVHLPRQTLATFAIDGSKITSSGTTVDDKVSAPFLTSLSHYFNKHLAMRLDLNQLWGQHKTKPADEHIYLSKIACGAFVLGAEGRVKFVANPEHVASMDSSAGEDGANDHEERTSRLILRANENILRALVRRAVGEDLQVLHQT
ncbi:hypothetical protein T310_1621 [Rasamsonia emersonii CBS 393.64]|uniref:Uncharacterized protein n=1 Tax=Rasamsonia emersonii (strain ATCC 16479 / CBS 393.64 / IMI 116815) TaxID=1408163 RepID=A0A0F4Z2M5_RASE3|nr:hypothetical protein T310_1621 [Rasamsonia emersonii CBS 393.64]KKA24336.1 hypothetical protein T310_1621 [Rasamsonia emersonii CBS 393.64]